jgi:phage FluMu protein Com
MLKVDEKFWKEVRCTNCRRLLAMEYIYSGRIMIKCRCGEMNTITYKTPNSLIKKLNNNEEMIFNREKTMSRKGGEKT